MGVLRFFPDKGLETDPLKTGGDPPDNGDMEARVVKLEDFAVETRDRLTRIETKLDATATKAEVHDLKAELIKWIVGVAIGLGAAGITVMSFVLNNATPKPVAAAPAPLAPQPPTIIINVPPSPPAVAAPVPAPTGKRP